MRRGIVATYKEIVTKAVIGKGKKVYTDKYTISFTFEIIKYGKKRKKCIIPLSGKYNG